MRYSDEAPTILWDTTHSEGENLLIHLGTSDPILNLIVIPREVLSDALRTSDRDLVALALANRERIGTVFARAWDPDRVKDLFEITGTGLRNRQFWLELDDFG